MLLLRVRFGMDDKFHKTIVLIWSETMKAMRGGKLMLTTPRSLVQITEMFIYFINDFVFFRLHLHCVSEHLLYARQDCLLHWRNVGCK